MTGPLIAWLRGRSAREQRLLAIMAALIAIVLAWLAVIRPMGDLLADARRRHGDAVIDAARAETQAAEIAAYERTRPRRSSMPVAARVAATASDAGLAPARTTPRGDAVTVSIAAVRPRALFGWIARLEGGEGLIVDTLAARVNPDRTLSVELTIRARRG